MVCCTEIIQTKIKKTIFFNLQSNTVLSRKIHGKLGGGKKCSGKKGTNWTGIIVVENTFKSYSSTWADVRSVFYGLKRIRNWTVAQWSKISFSVERKVRESGGRLERQIIHVGLSSHLVLVHCLSLKSMQPPTVYKDKLFGEAYFIFQQDWVSAHTAKGTMQELAQWPWLSCAWDPMERCQDEDERHQNRRWKQSGLPEHLSRTNCRLFASMLRHADARIQDVRKFCRRSANGPSFDSGVMKQGKIKKIWGWMLDNIKGIR